MKKFVFGWGLVLFGVMPVMAAQAQQQQQEQQSPKSGQSDLQIEQAWVKATLPGQKVAVAYMQLQAPHGAVTIQAWRSPVAQAVQLHEMKMDGDVMRMDALPQLALPAQGKAVLQSGGLHLMLTGLKRALQAGSTLPLTVDWVDAQGRKFSRTLTLPVQAQAPAPAPEMPSSAASPSAPMMMHHHGM